MKLLQHGLMIAEAGAAPVARDLLIDGDTIVDLLEPGTQVPDAEPIDVDGMLIHPGLVNAHMHAHGTLAKGTADRWSLELLLSAGASMCAERHDEEKYLSALLGAGELALKGCTSVYDMCLEMPLPTPQGVAAVARGYADIGLRAVIAPMLSDIDFFNAIPGLMDQFPADLQTRLRRSPTPASAPLDAMRDILKSWPVVDGDIRPALAPTIPLHCSEALLTGCRDLAAEFGLSIQSHLQESKLQALSGLKRYGMTLTAYLDSLGILGPHFVASHGVWLDDDDMARLGSAGASVSHNPGSNLILGSGLADVRRMMDHGINVSLGTDGANCADNLNMYESMRTALRVSHVRSPDMSAWLSATEAFEMATVSGAKALGLRNVGRIQPGYQADLVLLDLGHVNWLPRNDANVQLVQSEDGAAVHSTMVRGRWVVRDHELVNCNLRTLRDSVNTTLARLKERSVAHSSLFENLKPAISCFCPMLMRSQYRVERFGSS